MDDSTHAERARSRRAIDPELLASRLRTAGAATLAAAAILVPIQWPAPADAAVLATLGLVLLAGAQWTRPASRSGHHAATFVRR